MYKNTNIKIKNLKWLWLSILFILLDLGSKYWIKVNFMLGEIKFILSGINIYYIQNSGLFFGYCVFSSVYWSYLLIILNIFFVVIFIIFLYQSVGCIEYFNTYHAAIIGGALGNLLDRIFYGAVTDFIDLHIGNLHWPIFNIADILISIGMLFLFTEYRDDLKSDILLK